MSPEYEAGYSDGKSSLANDWEVALSEIAGLPDAVASLSPRDFALWLSEGVVEIETWSREYWFGYENYPEGCRVLIVGPL